MNKLLVIITVFSFINLTSCTQGNKQIINMNKDSNLNKSENVKKSKSEWKSVLTDHQYYVIIEKGTEKPFTGEYWDVFEDGVYKCAACGFELFDSDSKFDAHCGWPSFYESLDSTKIITSTDFNLGYERTEIMCANCGGHLGHVFPDGPEPTGLRYCVNSASIKLDSLKK